MNVREMRDRLNTLIDAMAQVGIAQDELKVFLTSGDGARVDEIHSIDLELDDNPEPGVYFSTEGDLQ